MSPLLFLILIPLGAFLFILLGAPARFTAIAATGLNLVLSLLLFHHYDYHTGGWQFLGNFALLPSLGLNFSLGADGLSMIMVALTTLVSFAAMLMPPIYLKTKEEEETPTNALTSLKKKFPGLFYGCLLLISAGLLGAFTSLDLFFLYGFHEIALIPVFIMIGIWGSGDKQSAAWKATLYLGTGSFLVLLAILGLYLAEPAGMRSFDLRSIMEMNQAGTLHPGTWIYLLFLIGFGTLVSLVPFHSWAAPTYSSSPTPTAMLHAGVLKKFGLYGLLRLALPLFPQEVTLFSNVLLLMLTCNILYIGYVTIAQRRFDKMLAYSSVMHMGYIFLGLATMQVIGLKAATFLMFAHGLSVAALFALSGALRARTGTLNYEELGGLAKVMPNMSLIVGFAVMASLGLPGFGNFVGELLVFFSATAQALFHQLSYPFLIATIVAVWGIVLSAIYLLRSYRAIFFGPLSEEWKHLPDLSSTEGWAIGILLAVLLTVGVVPQLIFHLLAHSFC